MQPIEVSREMLHRITTAMADLDSVKLLEEERGATRSTR
jgi:hypothetical protein